MARIGHEFTAQDSAGNIIPSADVEVRNRSDNSFATIYDAETGGFAITQPGFQTDSNGDYEFWVEPGRYNVTVGSGVSAKTYPINQSNVSPAYDTRQDFVDVVSDLDLLDGTIVTADGLQYKASSGSTDISDLPGFVPAGFVDVRHFGAVVDGVTDDVTEAQAAVDYVNSLNGGDVLIPPGTMLIDEGATSGSCLVMKSNVKLKGAGKRETIIKRKAGALAQTVQLSAATDVSIFDLTIDGNKQAETQGTVAGFSALRGAGVTNLHLENLVIKNGIYYGLGLQDESTLYEEDTTIIDCEFADNGGWSTSGTTSGDNLDIKSGFRVFIRGCNSYGSAQKGFDIRCEQLFMSDCRSFNNSSAGFDIRGRGDLTDSVRLEATVKGCMSSDNGSHGFTWSQTAGPQLETGRLTFSSCHSYNNGGSGFFTNDTDAAAAMITGCVSYDNAAAGIRGDANDIVVTGCVLFDNGTYGFDNAATNQRVTVVGNAARGNTTAQIRTSAGANNLYASNNTN